MNSIFKIFTLVVTIFYWQNIYSQALYVDSAIMFPGNGGSWSTAFANLGDALDSAHKNPAIDSILVAKGTYFPDRYPFGLNTGNVNDYTFHIRAGLEVYGGYSNGGGTRNISANPTILSGATATDSFIHVVLILDNVVATDSTILDGLVIEKSYFRSGARSMPLGVGSATVYHITGGGIYTWYGTNIINNCVIRNNNAADFGAGIGSYLSISTITNCVFENNYDNNIGTGIYMNEGIYHISKNKFQNNIGNPIYANGAIVNISDNVIINNSSSAIKTESTNSLNIIRNLISGNNGVGIDIIDSTSFIYNNVIANNNGGQGGGIQTRAGTHYIVNNTIKSNSASIGGGLYVSYFATIYLYNNIIWDNIDELHNKGSIIIAKNNLFKLDSVTISTVPLASGSSNNLYQTNPQFKGGSGADSLSLIPTSLLIDKGDSTLYTWSEKLDYLLANRIHYNNIDIGAIETNSCVSMTDMYDTICFGDTINFGGETILLNGVYYDTLLNILNCDSIIALHLSTKHCFRDTFTIKSCMPILMGDSVIVPTGYSLNTNTQSLHGFTTVNPNGTLNYTKNNSFTGKDTILYTSCITTPSAATFCDSTYIYIMALPNDSTLIYDTICSGNSYSFNGINLTATGVYRDTIIAVNGCDSIIILNLMVKPTSSNTFNTSICNGKTYLFNGVNRSVSGIYHDTLTAANGCDSFIILNLTVLPKVQSTISTNICKGKSYLFNGVQQSTAGIYYDTFVSANGCDSIVTLYLGINPAPIITFQDSSDFTTAYTWRGNSYTSAGTYYDTSSAANKCDTIYKLVLTLDTTSTPSPIAKPLTITYSNDTLYASIDSATSYQWYLCGPPMKKITGANKRYFYTKDKSKYTVVVTKNGKTDTAACAPNSPSSIGVYSSYSGLSYFPNPVIHKLTIDLPDKYRNITLAISDIKGQKLWSKEYRELKNTTVDMDHFANGIYFLHINSESGLNEMIKLVKDGE